MDNIKVEMSNLTDEEREQLMALVNKANKPKRWKPQSGEKIWYFEGTGEVQWDYWKTANVFNDLYNFGNCFKTEEEAEFELEKRKVYNELLTYAEEHNECEIDWEDREQVKVYICYSHFLKEIKFNAVFFVQNIMQIYFTSREIAQNAVKAVGEERIKKYLFGVE